MSEIEKDELNLWIAKHVFGAHIYTSGMGSEIAVFNSNAEDEYECVVIPKHPWDSREFNPCNAKDDAMIVLEKCRRHTEQLYHDEQYFSVRIDLEADESCIYLLNQKYMECRHIQRFEGVEELPTAICLFAKQLFSKRKDAIMKQPCGWSVIKNKRELDRWEKNAGVTYRLCGAVFPCLVREYITSDENKQTESLTAFDLSVMTAALAEVSQ